MQRFGGKMRRRLKNQSDLGKLPRFLDQSIKFGLVVVSTAMLCCYVSASTPGPLSSFSFNITASNNTSSGSTWAKIVQDGKEQDDFRTVSNFPGEFKKKGLSSTSSLSSSLLSTVVVQVVKFLVRSLLGKQWLSEDFAWRRLDDLKTNIFNYYAHRNLFSGVMVEQARNGSIGFPSLEGALLSLAFLTFSVFLIDLIQTILNRIRLRRRTTASVPAIGRTDPSDMSHEDYLFFGNNTRPLATDTMTTLSSKIFSAIEKPWNFE